MNNLAQRLNNLAQPFWFANQAHEQPHNLFTRARMGVITSFIPDEETRKQVVQGCEVVHGYEIERKNPNNLLKKVVPGCAAC